MTTTKKMLPAVGALLSLLAALAGACDAGMHDYEVYLDDETGQWVVDNPRDGIPWLRCPVGQEWLVEPSRCEGTADLLVFDQAKDACPPGFSWPDNGAFASVLCDPVDVSSCDAQYGSCSDCARCRLMFEIDKGRYVSAASDEQADSVTVYDFATGCASSGDQPDSVSSNVRCIKD
ncbi:MAG TPA: hypothetical protein VM285_07625 [Polyangia bacterium]|nr:hypothetical protein [Polyangia bacterium]